MKLKIPSLLVAALSGLLCPLCFPQQQTPRPLRVYILDVNTDLKGDFAQLGPELTAALQTAFSSEPEAFTLLDRTNLNELVRANQLGGDVAALIQGRAPSSKIAHVLSADGFIHGELRDGADGATLSVILVKLDSEVVWSDQITYTPAKWLTNDIQKSAASLLVQDAVRKLLPARAITNKAPLSNQSDQHRTGSEPAPDMNAIQAELAKSETPYTTRVLISRLQIRGEDPHICQKSNDVYYAHWGSQGPVPPASPQYSNPEFLFDAHHEDSTINWAGGFTGTVPVCFVINEQGIPEDVRFPQPPDDNIQEHIKARIAGWRYSPGTSIQGWWDKNRKPIKVQIAFSFVFQ